MSSPIRVQFSFELILTPNLCKKASFPGANAKSTKWGNDPFKWAFIPLDVTLSGLFRDMLHVQVGIKMVDCCAIEAWSIIFQQIELPHILRRFFEVPHIFLTVICHGILKKSFLHFEMIVSTGFVYCTRINVWKLKESPLTRVECVEAQTDSPKKSVFGDC